ncbi:HAMP domain-containing histidine kinase [Desulfovibrio sp. OttesenSCG-928-O18]|nr:HAMP domain-containing histidine kinase [Desulfovibrio sp. OttesenSCG-928-O18]
MRHLWQRIFAYSLVLILLSQAAVYLLHVRSVDKEEIRRFITESTLSLASGLEGRSAVDAHSVANLFNRKSSRVWLENAAGEVIAGAAPEKRPLVPPKQETRDGLAILETPHDPERLVATAPVALRDGSATLFMSFGPPRGKGLRVMFFQGLLVLSSIGVLLALWMAWRVSRPLRTLRREVMEIAGGNLDRRVTVSGKDEISDVSEAVNHMADTVSKNLRSMRELVANISHEMRSPLARMQVSLAMLEEDVAKLAGKESQPAARLALITEELAHMNKLIGTTLLSSKLDLQGKIEFNGPVAFSELCAENARRHELVFAERNIRFTRVIAPEIFFPGEETLLTNLVSNLLDNAAKYTDEHGEVTMRLVREGEGAILEVENTHAPLCPDVIDHIFEPFYRGGIATGTGVGLGLSLVSKIAALHGGKAMAENTPEGVKFAVRFGGGRGGKRESGFSFDKL